MRAPYAPCTMVTARLWLMISTCLWLPPNSPSRVQSRASWLTSFNLVVRKQVTSPPSSSAMFARALKMAWSWRRVLGLAHQGHLKQAVVQGHRLGGGALEAPHRDGVGHHAVAEAVGHDPAVVLHRHGVGLDGAQPGGPLQYIGQVAQHALDLLGGGVGHVGKGPEGGNVDEILPVEEPMSTGRGVPAAATPASSFREPGRLRFRAKSLVVPAGM